MDVSRRLRGVELGQDRYKRRYWLLAHCGGVFLESLESSEAKPAAASSAAAVTSADSGAGVTSDKRGETSSAENASYETMSAIDGQTTPAKDLKPAAAQNSHVNHDNKPTSADVDVTRVKQEASDVARFNLNADDCKTPLKHEPSDVADVSKPREQPPLMNGHVDDNRVKQLLKDCIQSKREKTAVGNCVKSEDDGALGTEHKLCDDVKSRDVDHKSADVDSKSRDVDSKSRDVDSKLASVFDGPLFSPFTTQSKCSQPQNAIFTYPGLKDDSAHPAAPASPTGSAHSAPPSPTGSESSLTSVASQQSSRHSTQSPAPDGDVTPRTRPCSQPPPSRSIESHNEIVKGVTGVPLTNGDIRDSCSVAADDVNSTKPRGDVRAAVSCSVPYTNIATNSTPSDVRGTISAHVSSASSSVTNASAAITSADVTSAASTATSQCIAAGTWFSILPRRSCDQYTILASPRREADTPPCVLPRAAPAPSPLCLDQSATPLNNVVVPSKPVTSSQLLVNAEKQSSATTQSRAPLSGSAANFKELTANLTEPAANLTEPPVNLKEPAVHLKEPAVHLRNPSTVNEETARVNLNAFKNQPTMLDIVTNAINSSMSQHSDVSRLSSLLPSVTSSFSHPVSTNATDTSLSAYPVSANVNCLSSPSSQSHLPLSSPPSQSHLPLSTPASQSHLPLSSPASQSCLAGVGSSMPGTPLSLCSTPAAGPGAASRSGTPGSQAGTPSYAASLELQQIERSCEWMREQIAALHKLHSSPPQPTPTGTDTVYRCNE